MIGKRLRKKIRQLHNILYTKEKEICLAYISKINSNCEKEVILLMIPNEEEDGVIKHWKNYLHCYIE